MKTVLKNVEGLDSVLCRMGLAGYAERAIQSYTRSVQLGQKLGKSPENVEQDELHARANASTKFRNTSARKKQMSP